MSKAGRTKQWHIMSVFNSVIKLFCYQNAHWQHVVYKNVMVSIRYHNIFKRAHTCRYARHLVARTHVWTRARMRNIYSSHTCSRASNTQWHTHYQVIHQLIGTHNVHILRETVRAEKADPAPAPQLYHSAHPTPHILKYSGPHRGPHPLVWPAASTTPQQIKNPARGGLRVAGPRGLLAETRTRAGP